METKRYYITAAQGEAKVNKKLLKSIETYCEHNDAELLILPMQGKHISEEHLDELLLQYNIIEKHDYKLNDKLKIKNYKVKPQAIRPLTGLEQLVKGDRSAIIAGTKINVKAIPNSSTRMAKLLMSTGAITHPNYAEQHRIGTIAKADHEYGGIIVEVTGKKSYHARYVQALKNGKFCDIDKMYDGDTVTDIRAKALVAGDIHTLETDPVALKATMRMIDRTQPENIFLHDLFDGSSISHHDVGDLVELQHNYKKSQLSLEYELKATAKMLENFVSNMPEDCTLYVVASNHNEVLNRYLREGRFVNEPQNIEVACKLLQDMFDDKDPLEEGIKQYYDIPKNVKFLKRSDDLRIKGYYFPYHGDKGANGARGSVNTFSKSLEKCITAHTHTPNKYRNALSVGTLSNLQQRYNVGGPSSWLATNALLFGIGTTQLINIINGSYCEEDEEHDE